MLILLTLLIGCPKPAPAADSEPAVPTYMVPTAAILTTRVTPEGLTQVEVDLDGDAKANVTNFYRERTDAPRLLMRKDIDLNRDGRIDVRTSYDDGGLRTQEEMDGDFDGRADWVDHYIGGKRAYSEVDTDFNGTFDLFKYFENGACRRKERDTNGDSRVDFWEYLDEKGNVTKTGRDIDNDGQMEDRQ